MIKSKFYLIRGDGIPIYVGFTNRPIKQRFTEHKADKDFSEYHTITIEKLDEVDYEFTWDESILYKNANEVSVREAQLVKEYNTQDSKYQKAIGGGQVWSYEKWFVRSNKNNPKYKDMSTEDINSLIDIRASASRYMANFIAVMNDEPEEYMIGFISGMNDCVSSYMKAFVNRMISDEESYMSHFVEHMKDPVSRYMSDFVNHMQLTEVVYMSNFIGAMIPVEEQYMSDFINGMKMEENRYMKDFINHMNNGDKYNDRY